ncbi:DUF1611 domain-containing protein [Sphingosinicella microcystinivorans]|uniref:DUF1611 domain-containing protein n=1 Tax=Sphingosinicella microcystinivorans TaxID=335406 RepID=UPI0022F3A495|nr:DUF1611 domain-containing protein [Sphingosinicella microcystinivorans]WBX86120.1 DUF1611 domain-containing protein [Sphingosinicella microcystinivorans]
MTDIAKPYLLFLADAENPALAKTALGVRDWAREDCVGQLRLTPSTIDIGLPDLTPSEAAARGARSLLIGVAPVGGQLPEAWQTILLAALEAGLDIVSGLHVRLEAFPALAEAAARLGRTLHNVRHSDTVFPVATGRKRTGRRLLMVGTDCALGKKYTALALTKAMRERGIDATFRATGQTGIMIAGGGIAIDAVVADFIAGAAETLSPDAAPDHWDVIEGQGALFHPAYAGVTLGLLHGSQPDALVLCHDPARSVTSFFPDYPLPTLEAAIAAYLPHAQRTNPAARFVGVSLNTSALDEDTARRALEDAHARTGLPVFDPLRFGIEAVVDEMLSGPFQAAVAAA